MRLHGPARHVKALVVAAPFCVMFAATACTSDGRLEVRPSGATTTRPAHSHSPTNATSTTTSAGSLTISAVGDTILGNTPQLPTQPNSYLDPVKREVSAGADIVFANLEGTLTTETAGKCDVQHAAPGTCYQFRNPPSFVRYLKNAGMTVFSNANPHSYDFGAAGQAQTVRTIHDAGLAQTGLPGQITLVKARGVTVAFVAFAPYTDTANLLDLTAARALIRRAATEASVVVVYMHAGAEGADAAHVTGHEEYFLGEDRGNAKAFAHLAIDAGASAVIASGPHILRGMEFYKKHLVAYSLGNFASYYNFSTVGSRGVSAILHITLSTTGTFQSARIFPIYFTSQGQPMPGGNGISAIATLSTQDFGASAARISPSGVINPP